MAGVVVLDANVLIALYDERDAHHAWARQFFVDTIADELCISALTFAETLVRPTRAGVGELFQAAIADVGISVDPIDAFGAIQLATTRAESGLRMPDAVVLHTAQRRGGALATSDNTLAKAAIAAGITVFQP